MYSLYPQNLAHKINKGLLNDWKGNISLEYFMCVCIFKEDIFNDKKLKAFLEQNSFVESLQYRSENLIIKTFIL